MLDKVRPASLKAMTGRRNSGMRFGSLPVNTEKNCLRLAVRAELVGSSTATALGITGRGNAPVLDLCRKLVGAATDQDQPLEAFRGSTLCLTIRSIREAAGLKSTAPEPVLFGTVACAGARPCVEMGAGMVDRPHRALLKYNAARHALAAAHRVDEVKSIRDKAVAMQAYAKQANDSTLITQATEIRMRAERRAGELLIDMGQRKQREAKGGDRKSKLHAATLIPKLSDFGINKTQSSRWQRLAALDADTFEVKVEGASKRAYDGSHGDS
jgi:hypothetical protein